MEKDPDRWIDKPAFQWTPETPLPPEAGELSESVEREAAPENSDPGFRLSTAWSKSHRPRFRPLGSSTELDGRLPLLLHLTVGLVQGMELFGLFANQKNLSPFVFAGGLTMLIFAPLLLLAGLERMRLKPLLAWTGFASLKLFLAGAYHYWRAVSPDGLYPDLSLVVLTSLFLFISQSIAQSRIGDYPSYFENAWRLVIRVAMCGLVAGATWAVVAAGHQLIPARSPAPLIALLVPLSAAVTAQLADDALLDVLREALLSAFVFALPLALVLGFCETVFSIAGVWRRSLVICLVLGFLLVGALNASYRDGASWRTLWQRRAEFAGAFLLLPLVWLAADGLGVRIEQYGWTDARVLAAASVLMLGGYALCYMTAALISLGGGRWMQRIEISNLVLAFMGLTLMAALASPLADPARLSVATQAFRLEQRDVAPKGFDFAWLRDHGLRFGYQALATMAARKSEPLLARDASQAMAAPPCPNQPADLRDWHLGPAPWRDLAEKLGLIRAHRTPCPAR